MQPVSHSPYPYSVVQTSVVPSYAFLQAENLYLRQNIEWRDAVLMEQQEKIENLQRANTELQHDAMRWNKFKHIIDAQKGEMSAKQLQNIVDTGHRDGKTRV